MLGGIIQFYNDCDRPGVGNVPKGSGVLLAILGIIVVAIGIFIFIIGIVREKFQEVDEGRSQSDTH